MGQCFFQFLESNHQQLPQTEQKRLELTASKTNVRDVYDFKEIIGEGSYGVVKLAIQKNIQPQKPIAIKIIDKSKLKNNYYFLLRELEILKTLDHPNIIKFYEVYQNDMFCYICMEYCQGGSLLDLLMENRHLKEQVVSQIMQQLFSAVNHMHSKKIVHRDLKPENIFFLSNQADSEVKIVNFSLSNRLNNQKLLKTQIDSQYNVSPDILLGKYDYRCDNWSLGVLLYFLLVGYPPFHGENKQEMFEKIKNGKYDMKGKQWDYISSQAKDLISKLLIVERNKRLSIKEALQHPFIKKYQQQNNIESPRINRQNSDDNYITLSCSSISCFKISDLLIKYSNTTKLKKEFMKILINQLSELQIEDLNYQFKLVDKDQTGVIRISELQKIMEQEGFKHSKKEIQALIRNISNESQVENLVIKYSEFIAATLNQIQYLKEEKLWSLFKYLDSSNTNSVTVSDLQEWFLRNGRDISVLDIQKMLDELHLENKNQITFNELKQLMTGQNVNYIN